MGGELSKNEKVGIGFSQKRSDIKLFYIAKYRTILKHSKSKL